MASKFIVRRGLGSELEHLNLADGQLLFAIDEQKIYLDNGSDRVEFYKKDIDELLTKIADAKKAGTDAQSDVNDIANKLGNLPEDKTIEELITASEYDDTEIRGKITANENAIATLNGSGEGSVSKAVADAVAALINDAPEAYDTLKEISDWISSHSDSASAMNTAITTNTQNITKLNGDETTEGSVAYTVKVAIDGLDSTVEAVAGKYISAITQIDGKLTATQEALPALEWGSFADAAAVD